MKRFCAKARGAKEFERDEDAAGASTRRASLAARIVSDTFRIPNPQIARVNSPSENGRSIASATTRLARGALPFPSSSISAEKSLAVMSASGYSAASILARSSVPAQRSNIFPAGACRELFDGALSPLRVDSHREHAIGGVVRGRDAVEHLANRCGVLRLLRGAARHLGNERRQVRHRRRHIYRWRRYV